MVRSIVNRKRNEKLLREFIRSSVSDEKQALREYGDEFGEIDFGTPADLHKMFIQPFTDVLKTTKAAVHDVSTKAGTIFTTVAQGLPSLLVPGLSRDYGQIFDRERQAHERIKRKYGDVFKRTGDALKDDAIMAAFIANPVAVLGSVIALKAPETALDIADELSGNSDIVRRQTDELRASLGYKSESAFSLGNLLLEADPNAVRAVSDLLRSPEMVDALNDSEITQGIRRDGQLAINSSLNDVLDRVKNIQKIDDLKELERSVGKTLSTQKLDDLEPAERSAIEQALVTQAKETIFRTYAELMDSTLKDLKSSSVPTAADTVKAWSKAIKRVKEIAGD